MESYILDIKPVGHEGQKVLVEYFDTDTYELKTKIDDFWRLTVTRELIPSKHHVTPQELISALKKEYPRHSFQALPYGKLRGGIVNDSFDLPSDSKSSFIIWHRGNREDAKNLEFFVNEKQIFFRNPEKKYKARTHETSDQEELENISEELVNIDEVDYEDITFNSANLEVLCDKSTLNRLDKSKFRINVYVSNVFSSEKEFDAFYYRTRGKITRTKILKDNIDIKAKIEFTDKMGKKQYYMKVTSTLDDVVDKNLKLMSLYPKKEKGVHEIDATKLLYDPLLLNRVSQQLKDFFPIHSTFNPSLRLKMQPNYRLFPFLYLKDMNYGANIETALMHCKNFYEKNAAVIDLEILDFVKGEIPSGRIFMATLKSQTENKIYITKEAWNNSDYVNKVKEKFSDVSFEFVEDEIELIARLNKDASKYYKVIGHNFRDFDHEHLKKYNYPAQSHSAGLITQKELERVKQVRKQYGLKKLWEKSLDDILDTKEYVKRRVDILSDHKLATFAGFTKSIDYDEMRELIKSGTYDGLESVVDYTVNDGVKNWEFALRMIENSLVESFAVNKPLDSVFNSDPVKNFYDAGKRRYFMKMNTLRDRHEMSPRRHLKKLKSRLRPDEVLREKIVNIEQKFGKGDGSLYYPNIFIESFKPIINADPVLKFIYDRMLHENNIVLKTDLIWKLASALLVPIDKAKDCMEMAKLEFGKKYLLAEMYPSLLEADPDGQRKSYFGRKFRDNKSERDVSNTSFIFNQEYLGKVTWRYVNNLIYDESILQINNTYAEFFEKFMNLQFDARSKSYVISSIPENVYPGYFLGNIHYINLKDDWVVGKIGEEEIYLNVKKYKEKKNPTEATMASLVHSFLNNDEINKNDWLSNIYSLPFSDQKNPKNREFIKRILDVDPMKSKGMMSLFD